MVYDLTVNTAHNNCLKSINNFKNTRNGVSNSIYSSSYPSSQVSTSSSFHLLNNISSSCSHTHTPNLYSTSHTPLYSNTLSISSYPSESLNTSCPHFTSPYLTHPFFPDSSLYTSSIPTVLPSRSPIPISISSSNAPSLSYSHINTTNDDKKSSLKPNITQPNHDSTNHPTIRIDQIQTPYTEIEPDIVSNSSTPNLENISHTPSTIDKTPQPNDNSSINQKFQPLSSSLQVDSQQLSEELSSLNNRLSPLSPSNPPSPPISQPPNNINIHQRKASHISTKSLSSHEKSPQINLHKEYHSPSANIIASNKSKHQRKGSHLSTQSIHSLSSHEHSAFRIPAQSEHPKSSYLSSLISQIDFNKKQDDIPTQYPIYEDIIQKFIEHDSLYSPFFTKFLIFFRDLYKNYQNIMQHNNQLNTNSTYYQQKCNDYKDNITHLLTKMKNLEKEKIQNEQNFNDSDYDGDRDIHQDTMIETHFDDSKHLVSDSSDEFDTDSEEDNTHNYHSMHYQPETISQEKNDLTTDIISDNQPIDQNEINIDQDIKNDSGDIDEDYDDEEYFSSDIDYDSFNFYYPKPDCIPLLDLSVIPLVIDDSQSSSMASLSDRPITPRYPSIPLPLEKMFSRHDNDSNESKNKQIHDNLSSEKISNETTIYPEANFYPKGDNNDNHSILSHQPSNQSNSKTESIETKSNPNKIVVNSVMKMLNKSNKSQQQSQTKINNHDSYSHENKPSSPSASTEYQFIRPTCIPR